MKLSHCQESTDPRVFLFLQGHPSTFACHLAHELDRLGQKTLKINLCTGEWLYWRKRGAFHYRGGLRKWEAFLEQFVIRERVTDLLYYGDRHPYHRIAMVLARRLGLKASTYEFGYLRPDWLTLEREGMSTFSHFPVDPMEICRIADSVPRPDLAERYPYTFAAEAFHEVAYNLATYFGRIFYPFYDQDRYYNTLVDYVSYIPRLLAQGRRGRRARRRIASWTERAMPFFLVPLQMQSDYQLRANSPYADQRKLIEEVMCSFAQHAASDQHLVFKIHPLDNGLEAWSKVVGRTSRRYGLSGRVHTIDGGDLTTLIRHAQGTVLINSTVGLHALRAGCPVKVMGVALFDIEGLTHQGPLDGFWRQPTKPDPDLMDAFVRAIAGTIQVKGNFFTAEGRKVAIAEMARRLVSNTVNGPLDLLEPPRLARARALGVPLTELDVALKATQTRSSATGVLSGPDVPTCVAAVASCTKGALG